MLIWREKKRERESEREIKEEEIPGNWIFIKLVTKQVSLDVTHLCCERVINLSLTPASHGLFLFREREKRK